LRDSNGEVGFVLVAKRIDELISEKLKELNSNNENVAYFVEAVVEKMFLFSIFTRAFRNQILFLKCCCLSGGGTKLARERLLQEFSSLNVAYKVHISNDSIAAIFTAFKHGLFVFFY
jgi:hypothetical protein